MHLRVKKIHVSFLKTIPIVFLSVLGFAFFITLVFLYRNFYLTIAQVETVEELERTVARERLNKKLWNTVMQHRRSKLPAEEFAPASSTDSLLIRDPFQPF